MKPEKIIDAIGGLRQERIAGAQSRKRAFPLWARYAAAAAAFVLVVTVVGLSLFPPSAPEPSLPNTDPEHVEGDNLPNKDPEPVEGDNIIYAPTRSDAHYFATYLAAPNYPEELVYPEEDDYGAISDWELEKLEVAIGSTDIPINFLKESAAAVLSGSKENTAFSPISLYMALSMLAETSNGESRQQILDLLRCDDIDSLRQGAKQLWQKHYNGDGRLALQLSNALFLNNRQSFHKDTVDILATDYYASVLRGEMGSPEYDALMQEWISKNTGGMLDDSLENYTTEEDLAAILTSTIYFRGTWTSEFIKERNTVAPFYTTDGERDVEYMHKSGKMPYYMSENFTAVQMKFTRNGCMWLIKPDEGVSVEEVISEGKLMGVLAHGSTSSVYGGEHSPTIILTVPKFDYTVKNDLITPLKKLGVTDVFDEQKADLSSLIADENVDGNGAYVSAAGQEVRVTIDEEGCTAAAVTQITEQAADAIIDKIPEYVEFTLDHPFLYVIVSEFGEPLFAGTIQDPSK